MKWIRGGNDKRTRDPGNDGKGRFLKECGEVRENRPVFIPGEGQEVHAQFLQPFRVRLVRAVRENEDAAAAFRKVRAVNQQARDLPKTARSELSGITGFQRSARRHPR